MPRISEENRLKMGELFALGHTKTEISEKLGCSRRAVHDWINRFKVNPSPLNRGKKRTTLEQDDLIRRIYDEAGGCVQAQKILKEEHGLKVAASTIMNRVNQVKNNKYVQRGSISTQKSQVDSKGSSVDKSSVEKIDRDAVVDKQ
jgi:transposase